MKNPATPLSKTVQIFIMDRKMHR